MAEAARSIYPPLQGTEEGETNQVLKTLKKHHDKAYADIQVALRLDEQSKRDEAIRFYSMGLQSIAQAMKLNCKGSGCVGGQWEHARSMQQKMKKTALQMKRRLESLEQEQREQAGAAGGHDEVVDPPREDSDTDILSLYEDSGASAPRSLPSYAQSTTDAREVLHITQGVQLFFINSMGHVSAPSCPGPLKLYKFPEGQRLAANQPPAFLQVGEWLYPLLPGQSPSLKTADGVYMFPDVCSPDEGASVGVIFAPQVSKSEKSKFQQLIQQLTALKDEQVPSARDATTPEVPGDGTSAPSAADSRGRGPAPPYERRGEQERVAEREAEREAERGAERGVERDEPMDALEETARSQDVGQKIAKGIEIGAEWISWGVVKGAELGSRLVGSGAKKLKQHIQPEDKPKEIDEKYQTGMVYARKATGVAVKVSVVVLDSVCYLTKRVAEEVGPVISKQANKMLTSGDDETDGKRKAVVDGVVQVTASGIRGFGRIYQGLEVAAIQLAKSLSQATVETVHHKYGNDAGRLTDNSLSTVGNIGVSAYNFNCLGVKALAKRTAKDTGKVVVRDMEDSVDKEGNSRQT